MKDEQAFEWLQQNDLSYKIWENKYRHNNESFNEWLTRVSGRDEELKQLIKEKKFLFGGRILANRGLTDAKLTLSNCYVITPPEDNLESIFECASKLARTFSYGGGCGIDLSKLRPNGAKTHNASKTSTGPISFMDIFSQVTGTISQQGRRGALMISLDVRHPDVEDFIDCKTDLSKVNYANISVRVNNEFMKAVMNDDYYILRWPCDQELLLDAAKTIKPDYNVLTPCYCNSDFSDTKVLCGYIKIVKAKELFHRLAKNNWDYAEPGMLYWDQITNYNLLSDNKTFEYAGVNPCAEEPLPAGGSCLLGSINLAEFVEVNNNIPTIKIAELEKAVDIAIKSLNIVLMEGLHKHPLEEQRDSVSHWRQVGLGTMGLADMLIKLKQTYGSAESLETITIVYFRIAKQAVLTSLELAKKYGHFTGCDKEKLINSPFIQQLDFTDEILNDIKTYGLYNSQLLTCAPTGSISTMLQISGGVEPIFAMKYTRTTKSLDNKDQHFDVYTKIAADWLKENPGQSLPSYFVESKDILPLKRIVVQSILQKYIDASISSTVNLPYETTIEDVEQIYLKAWQHKLKGITIFRQGCARIPILEAPKKEEKHLNETITPCFDCVTPVSRKVMGVTTGSTFCKKCACGTLYITTNKDRNGNLVEIFTHTSKGGICQANLNAETRMASLALRSGVKVSEVIDQLKGISCPACTTVRAKGGKIDGISCPDIIAKTIAEFIENKPSEPLKSEESTNIPVEYEECPECHEKTLIREAGCKQCTSCGYSKCE